MYCRQDLDPASVCEVLTVRKFGVFGIETETVAEYAGVVNFCGEFEGDDVSFLLRNLELVDASKAFFAVFLTVNNHLETEVSADAVGVYDYFDMEWLTGEGAVEFAAVTNVEYFDAIPGSSHVFFPVYDVLG